ncbi:MULTISPECIES: hypothetical protein [Helicobacter]|uniref:hypothetical protein n=1 Tax=Helicobacter TaxID=209 RepID=UPI0013763CA9|nr:hypothetical protein [Helicobacter sp. MIT 03-1616]
MRYTQMGYMNVAGGGLKALQEYFYLLEQESDISYAALFEKFSNKVSLKDTKE